MAGPRSRPQVVNRRRTRTETPEATRRAGGRTVVTQVDKPAPAIAPRRARPTESPEAIAAKARWVELTSKLSSRHGKPYYADRTYAAGDVLLHKRHGMGVIESVVHEEAIMVLFRDGTQVIEMAQAPTR
jgi:urease gamma subunit